jgi:hypothetical protein
VAEIPVLSSAGDFGPLAAQALSLLGRVPAPAVNVVNMIPPKFEQYRVPGARNIGCTMFETDRLPVGWVEQCNAMDAIWVPADWVRTVFLDSGVRVPVSVVGVDAVEAPWVAPPDEGPFRLLSVFEWSERKNPLGLLRAWCAAFDGDDGVALTLKVSRHPDPQQTFDAVQAGPAARADRRQAGALGAAHRHRAAGDVGRRRCACCTSAAMPSQPGACRRLGPAALGSDARRPSGHPYRVVGADGIRASAGPGGLQPRAGVRHGRVRVLLRQRDELGRAAPGRRDCEAALAACRLRALERHRQGAPRGDPHALFARRRGANDCRRRWPPEPQRRQRWS